VFLHPHWAPAAPAAAGGANDHDGPRVVGASFTPLLLDASAAMGHASWSPAPAAAPSAPFQALLDVYAGFTPAVVSQLGLPPAASDLAILAGAEGAGMGLRGGDWGGLAAALSGIGVGGDAVAQLTRLVAGLLLLGNVVVAEGDAAAGLGGGADGGTVPGPGAAIITTPAVAVRAAQLLGLPDDAFTETGVRRAKGVVSGSSGGGKAVTWSWKRAVDVRRALAAVVTSVWGRLVAWVTTAANAAVRAAAVGAEGGSAAWDAALEAAPPGASEPVYAAVLDGWSTAGVQVGGHGDMVPPHVTGAPGGSPTLLPGSPLAALHRNVASEKVHGLFLSAVWRAEAALFASEGVWEEGHGLGDWVDNAPLVDVFDNRRTGLLQGVAEAASFPRATDESLHAKWSTVLRRTPGVWCPATAGGGDGGGVLPLPFAVRHTAGWVTYTAAGLLAAARETSDTDITSLLTASTLPLLASIMAPVVGEAAADVCDPSRVDGVVAAAAGNSALTFARCIRPVDTPAALGRPLYVEPAAVQRQVTAAAALSAAALSRVAFAQSPPYADFYERYIILAERGGDLVYPPPPTVPLRDLCAALLRRVVTHPVFTGVDVAEGAVAGATRLFLKRPVVEALEALREVRLATMDRCAVRVQAAWRGARTRRALRGLWDGVRRLQAAWATLRARAVWLHTRAAVSTIQTAARFWLAYRLFNRKRTAAVRLQAWWRRVLARSRWSGVRAGVRSLHALVRGYIVRCHVMRLMSAAVRVQAAVRAWLARTRLRHVRDAAATAFQCAWRGYRFRLDNEDVTAYLALAAADRARGMAASAIAATWRGHVVRGRWQALRRAAVAVQRWMHAKLHRARFLRMRLAAVVMQAAARGFAAREAVRQLRTLQLIGDELWRVNVVREREALEVAKQHAQVLSAAVRGHLSLPNPVAAGVLSAAAVAASPTGATSSPRLTPFSHAAAAALTTVGPPGGVATTGSGGVPLACVLDLDVASDTSLVYPLSWMRAFTTLQAQMAAAGTRPAAIALGATHTAVVSEAGHVYTWGFGERGQCGHGRFSGESDPRLLSALLTDQHLAAAWSAAADGVGLGSGLPASPPAPASLRSTGPLTARSLPPGHSSSSRMGGVTSLRGGSLPAAPPAIAIRVRAVACGDEHTVALAESGVVYAWGSGRRGATGLGVRDATATPTPVPIAAALSGAVMGSGAGGGGGESTVGSVVGSDLDSASIAPTATDVDAAARVSEIAAGNAHTIALLATGAVVVWGAGPCNGLHPAPGTGASHATPDVLTPILVPGLSRVRVRHIASGPDFAGCVSADGDVYTWGMGTSGVLGLGEDVHRRRRRRTTSAAATPAVPPGGEGDDAQPLAVEYLTGLFRPRHSPSLVDGLHRFGRHARIVALACGGRHMVALSSTGRVYTWGSNSHGQLGVGVLGEVPEAVLRDHAVPVPRLPHVGGPPGGDSRASFAAGSGSSASPRPPAAGSYVPRPYIPVPVALPLFETRHAAVCVAGGRSTAVATDSGEVYVWGCTGAARLVSPAALLPPPPHTSSGGGATAAMHAPSSPAGGGGVAAAARTPLASAGSHPVPSPLSGTPAMLMRPAPAPTTGHDAHPHTHATGVDAALLLPAPTEVPFAQRARARHPPTVGRPLRSHVHLGRHLHPGPHHARCSAGGGSRPGVGAPARHGRGGRTVPARAAGRRGQRGWRGSVRGGGPHPLAAAHPLASPGEAQARHAHQRRRRPGGRGRAITSPLARQVVTNALRVTLGGSTYRPGNPHRRHRWRRSRRSHATPPHRPAPGPLRQGRLPVAGAWCHVASKLAAGRRSAAATRACWHSTAAAI